MSEKPAPVYVCPCKALCAFEHWDGIEMRKHLRDAHDFNMRTCVLMTNRIKLIRSTNWVLKKIPPPEPKRVKGIGVGV